MASDQAIGKLTAMIVKKYKPEKVILFGSFAYGKPNEASDIDLLVVKKVSRKKPIERSADLAYFLSESKDLPQSLKRRSFDPIVVTKQELNQTKNSSLFVRTILTKG